MEAEEEDIDRFLYGDEAEAIKQIPVKPILHKEVEHETINQEEGEFQQDDDSTLDDTMVDEEEIEIVLDGPSKPVTTRPTIDLSAVGQLNGQSITEVDLESFGDRPWRKPGADITDYFNYGFTEQTWRQYCMKQKNLREGKKEVPFAAPPLPFPPMMPFMFRPPPPQNLVPPPPPPSQPLLQQQAPASPQKHENKSPSREGKSGRSKNRSRSPSREHRETRRRRD